MPKFLVSALRDSQACTFVYNTDNNIIYDDNGKDALKKYKIKAHYVPTLGFTRDHNPNKKKAENNLLEISLGFNCNFKCKYCSQNLLKNKAYSGKPSDAYVLIEKLKKCKLAPTRIQLWGGEPLVYWKTIQVLLPELRKLYPNAQISLTTNGSLLDRNKIDFFAKYNCLCFISHDGPGNQFRDKDVLKQPEVVDAVKYAIKKLGNNIAIGATPNANNTNVIKIVEYFKDVLNLNDYSLNVGVHNIVRCHDSKDLQQVVACQLSKEDLETYTNTIFEVLNSPDKNYYGCQSLIFKRDNAIQGILSEEPIDAVLAECYLPFSNGLLIDMKGNVLTCHNHATQEYICGNIDDLSAVNAIGYNFWKNKERCRNCPVIHWCKGGCPSADDRANELACPNLYALYLGLFKAIFALLFGVYVTNVEKLE